MLPTSYLLAHLITHTHTLQSQLQQEFEPIAWVRKQKSEKFGDRSEINIYEVMEVGFSDAMFSAFSI